MIGRANVNALAVAMLDSRIAAGDIAHHSGRADDFARSTRQRIRQLYDLGRFDCTSTVEFELHWSPAAGIWRVIIDRDAGYFDHVIAATAAERFKVMESVQ